MNDIRSHNISNLIEIDGDFVRSDLISAICVEDEEYESFLNVHLIGQSEPIQWPFETRAEAESAQAKAVQAWLEDIGR